MKDVEVRWEVERFADDLIALAGEVEARMDERLADRDVLVHDDFARLRADDFTDQIADRARHLPPAFFPGANAARRPQLGVLVQAVASAGGHRAERVRDHINGVIEDREFFAPFKQLVHSRLSLFARLAEIVAHFPQLWKELALDRLAQVGSALAAAGAALGADHALDHLDVA